MILLPVVIPSGLLFTLGTDTSLLTAEGWDNATGLERPKGKKFVDAVGQLVAAAKHN